MEIKSTVTVNTTDIAARASEDSKDPKEAEKAAVAKRGGKLNKIHLCEPFLVLCCMGISSMGLIVIP